MVYCVACAVSPGMSYDDHVDAVGAVGHAADDNADQLAFGIENGAAAVDADGMEVGKEKAGVVFVVFVSNDDAVENAGIEPHGISDGVQFFAGHNFFFRKYDRCSGCAGHFHHRKVGMI